MQEPPVVVGKCSRSSYHGMQGRNSSATHTAKFQTVNKVAGGFVFSHVKCFPHSSPSQKIFILSLNYKDAESKVTINIIIKYLNNFEQGLGQKHETKLGMPCETAVGDDVEEWWNSVVVMVVWPSGWKCKAQGGGLGQKPETELL